MRIKRTSWDYQRDRYKQISLKFDILNKSEASLYSYLKNKENISGYIKDLIRRDIDPCYGCMGASFGDCESCIYHAINKD